MIPFTRQRLSQALIGGFLIGSSLIGYAQEAGTPGIVRITDARPKGVPAKTVGFGGHMTAGQYHSLGDYSVGGCPECGGDCQTGHCQHGHCHHGWLKRHFQEHYGKHSADYGFSEPGKSPIYRRGVQYNQYYPSAWYGTAGGGLAPGQTYPMVYMPTDTTQLGYYYQHVPFWMPNPNALPARPVPSQWHQYGVNGVGAYGHGYGASCPAGDEWVESTTVVPNSTPVPAPVNANPAPVPAPAPAIQPAPVPDAPRNDSAQNLHIRRASGTR